MTSNGNNNNNHSVAIMNGKISLVQHFYCPTCRTDSSYHLQTR